MKKFLSTTSLVALACAGALFGAMGTASAQVAGGTTTVNANVTASTQLALGWSVKKSLMGKTLYNNAGEKVGKVEDLIIAPDKNVSFVIVGTGGFVGIGRHDVAIPISQIQYKADRLVMANATKEGIKAMPEFTYASDAVQRDMFIAATEKEIAEGKAKLAELEKKSAAAASDAKVKIDAQIAALQADLKVAEAKLAELRQVAAARWAEFEAEVRAALTRLRKSIDSAAG